MVAGHPSVAGRAVLALALMIGFYVLALGIAVALVAIPIFEARTIGRVHIKLALLCGIAAVAILWSILPRIDRFAAPGPRLTADRHPRLFAALEEVAGKVGQEMPKEVYLLLDVNAWVAQRGGVMGFFSRRVMGLGLPLMQALTVDQMEAVLAHEFGHFHGGDTKLGPWVYKTRSAIIRTVQTLAQMQSVVRKPFEWYANMFLRITQGVSRAQEYAADALAVRVIGARPLAEGLQAVHGAAIAFQPYWQQEVTPVLGSGRVPRLSAGFQGFVESSEVSENIGKVIEAEMKSGKQDPFDSHPPLKERVRAALAAADAQGEERPENRAKAVSLLEDVPAAERELLAFLSGNQLADHQPIDWSEVGTAVYLPLWRKGVAASAPHLAGIDPGGLPGTLERAVAIGRALGLPEGVPQTDGNYRDRAVQAFAAGVTVALADRGWTVSALPGEPIVVRGDDLELEPFEAMKQLADGKFEPERWRALVEQAGIANVDLSKLGS